MDLLIAITLGLAMFGFVVRTFIDGVFDGERPGDRPPWVDDPNASV